MPEKDNETDSLGRRKRRLLTPQQKYEIWLQLIRKERNVTEAAAGAGVDPATVIKLKTVARRRSTRGAFRVETWCSEQRA